LRRSTNQAKKRVEGARRRGHADEEAPEDDEDGGGAEAGHRQHPARRAPAPLAQRGEREARGGGAGPGHGGPVPIDQEGEALPAAARRRVRPRQDVLLGQHPHPRLLPQPQIRHGLELGSRTKCRNPIRMLNPGAPGAPSPPNRIQKNSSTRTEVAARSQEPASPKPLQSKSSKKRDNKRSNQLKD